MVKSTTRIKPIGGSNTVTSLKMARKITTKYHKLQNKLQMKGISKDERKTLEKEMILNGGTDRYQKASKIATERFKSSRYVVRTMIEMGIKPEKGNGKLCTLEVGAINTQLQKCPWLDVTAIDLKSQHAKIIEQDFFLLDRNHLHAYDIIVCSMVINCVPCAYMRFKMLAMLGILLKKGDKSRLFLMLPKTCIKEIGEQVFKNLLSAMQYTSHSETETPKIKFWVLGKINDSGSSTFMDVDFDMNTRSTMNKSNSKSRSTNKSMKRKNISDQDEKDEIEKEEEEEEEVVEEEEEEEEEGCVLDKGMEEKINEMVQRVISRLDKKTRDHLTRKIQDIDVDKEKFAMTIIPPS